MPGSLFELVCRGCGAVHEISTGADQCHLHSGRPWHYEQMVCPRCQRLRSCAVGCHFRSGGCEECGGALLPWGGCVFFERTGQERGSRASGFGDRVLHAARNSAKVIRGSMGSGTELRRLISPSTDLSGGCWGRRKSVGFHPSGVAADRAVVRTPPSDPWSVRSSS
jgi:hypothetical protein